MRKGCNQIPVVDKYKKGPQRPFEWKERRITPESKTGRRELSSGKKRWKGKGSSGLLMPPPEALGVLHRKATFCSDDFWERESDLPGGKRDLSDFLLEHGIGR